MAHLAFHTFKNTNNILNVLVELNKNQMGPFFFLKKVWAFYIDNM